MAARRESFTVRVLRIGTAEPAGVGFVVDDTHIVTCAHVVNAALGRDQRAQPPPAPGTRIQVDFPMLGGPAGAPSRTCSVDAWTPPAADGVSAADVAGLTVLGDDLPRGAGPARLSPPRAFDQSVLAFGFPAAPNREGNGTWTELRLRSRVGGGVVQLDTGSESAIRVQPGYSGSPVVVADGDGDAVLGMLVAASAASAGRDAYAIPLSELARCWPAVLGRLDVPPCPYRGLGSFTADDADVFTGREDEVARLAALVRREALVIVTGPSGVGKSSLVNAGLIPLLRERGWAAGVFRPGGTPLEALARALLAVQEPGRRPEVRAVREWASMLQDSGLAQLGAELAVTLGQPVLLHADQLEEILDPAACPPGVSARFLDLLLGAGAPADGGLHLTGTLRADFWAQLLEHPDAGTRLAGRWFGLSPMSRDRLEQVITGPAEARDVSYQEGLARVIAADAGGGGGLPVLEFTLTQLWPHQRGRQLTLAAYQAIGGVAGALSAHAEQAYQQLIGDFADDRIRRVMLALVRSRDGAATATRRTTTRRRLGEDWPVAQALAARRLLITGGDPAKGDETAEITHEALIREWPRLAAWVDDDAAFQRWLAAAEERAADGDLLPDTRLADADRWIGERDADVPPEVRQLVDQSKSAYLRRITELEQARARAEQALRESEARRLAAAVDVVLSTPGVSRQVPVALAVEALRLAPVLEADVAARHAIRAAARGITRLSCDGSPKAVWFGSRGPLLALVKDKEIQVLDVAAGSLTVRVPERLGVRVLAFSPDGSRLAIGSGGFMSDGDARVIDCASGAEIACFDHARPVQALGFSPDGTRVVTGSGGMLTHDAAARVFDIGAGTEIVRLEHSIEVLAVSFSPDGTRLATGTDGRVGLARVFDTTSWAETLSVTQAGEVRAVVFSPDGTRIATGGTSGVRIVSADTGGLTARLDHDYTVTALVFSPDGTRLATGSGHHFLGGGWATRVFDAVGGTEISRLDHDGDVSFLGFSPDSTRLAVGSYPDVWFLDASNGAEIARFPLERPVPASGLALSPDSTRAAFADIYAPDPADAAIRVADVAGGTEVARFRPDGIAATVAMALSPDGSRIAFATSTTSVYDGPGTTRVVDVATGTEVGRFDHDNTVFDLAFGPDGTQIALGGSHAEPRSHSSASTETQVFDISTGAEITRLEHPDRATALAFSPDGAKIVAGQHDGTVQVFDAADGTEILRVKHDEGVYAAAFSPDSSRVVAGTGHSQRRAGSARVLALATGAEIARFDHGDPVFAVAFSPDGTRAACGSRRGVRVFDTATGVETACPDDEHPVYHVAFSRDGTRLVGGDNNDGVRVWVIGRDQLIEQALSRLVRNLTVQEWHRYIPGQPYRKTHQELA